MSHEILVSVIIPVYNAEKFLRKCLNSIVNQTYSSIEIIVVNDGSTDSSPLIISEFKDLDSRIVYINKANGGIGSAYLAALKNVTGQYVLFVDSDDYMELNAVERLVSLASEVDADLVSFGIRPITISGETVPLKHFNGIDLVLQSNDAVLSTHFNVVKHPSLCRLYRASLFEGVFIFEQNIGIDELLTPQLLLRCKSAVHTSEILYFALIRQDSVCRSPYTLSSVVQSLKVYDFLLAFMKSNLPLYYNIFVEKYLQFLHGVFVYQSFNNIEFIKVDTISSRIHKTGIISLKQREAKLSSGLRIRLLLIVLLPTVYKKSIVFKQRFNTTISKV